ncbi:MULTISPECIES: hypothetical protein [unclassified Arcicella]|uniref:hypothetical protein n=1 Tax=unclassified Arcicella TaxID=2644986 RepID=UPI00285F2F14|nr:MULTISPECIES: hypothetical protein [unclassified Arcicella]MDR6564971.1 hypothetical protein [Arcicella sp. BE51]MDR6814761.1 hypothetical protein [Arcicella sp. BE140]MDR6826207.1 hypothetical protein [Arcicella sp. BE139]
MKKAYIFIGVAIAVIIYLLTKKKGVVGVTGSNGESALSSVSSYVQNLLSGKDTTSSTGDNTGTENGTGTDTGDNTGTGTGTGDNTNTTTGATEPLSLRYNGGQFLYKKYNGQSLPSGGLGYLVNGTVIYLSNVYYSVQVGEYLPKANVDPSSPYNSSGVNVNMKLGRFIVSGTWIDVYGENKFTTLPSNGFGFTIDGAIVYYTIVNEGQENEYTSYFL